MNIVTNIYDRIITTAHQIITNDDIDNYNEDFSGMLYFKNAEYYQKFHEVSESIASILLQKKIGIFVMAYDTIAFCIRFHPEYSFSGINLRMISDSLHEIPQSTGDPLFIIGADELAGGFGWKPAQTYQSDEDCEIFPIIDFKGICIYYAVSKKRDSSRTSPQIFRSLEHQINSSSSALSYQTFSKQNKLNSQSNPCSQNRLDSSSVSQAESSYSSEKNPTQKNEFVSESDSGSETGLRLPAYEDHSPKDYYDKQNSQKDKKERKFVFHTQVSFSNGDKDDDEDSNNEDGDEDKMPNNPPSGLFNRDESKEDDDDNEYDDDDEDKMPNNLPDGFFNHDESKDDDDDNDDDGDDEDKMPNNPPDGLFNRDESKGGDGEEEESQTDSEFSQFVSNKSEAASFNLENRKLGQNGDDENFSQFEQGAEGHFANNKEDGSNYSNGSFNDSIGGSSHCENDKELGIKSKARNNGGFSLRKILESSGSEYDDISNQSLSFLQSHSSKQKDEANKEADDDSQNQKPIPFQSLQTQNLSSNQKTDSSLSNPLNCKDENSHIHRQFSFQPPQKAGNRFSNSLKESNFSYSLKEQDENQHAASFQPSQEQHFISNSLNEQDENQDFQPSQEQHFISNSLSEQGESLANQNQSTFSKDENEASSIFAVSSSAESSSSSESSQNSSKSSTSPITAKDASLKQQQHRITTKENIGKKIQNPMNLFDYSSSASTSATTSTSTSLFASSSTSKSASPTRNSSPSSHFLKCAQKVQPSKQRSKTTKTNETSKRKKRESKSGHATQIDDKSKKKQKQLPIEILCSNKAVNFTNEPTKTQEKRMKQQKLPLEPKTSKSKTSDADEIHTKIHKMEQQKLNFNFVNKNENSKNQKHHLIQSKLPLVKDQTKIKPTNNFSSEYSSEQTSNSTSSFSSSSLKNSQEKTTNKDKNKNKNKNEKNKKKSPEKLHQSKLPLSHQIKKKK